MRAVGGYLGLLSAASSAGVCEAEGVDAIAAALTVHGNGMDGSLAMVQAATIRQVNEIAIQKLVTAHKKLEQKLLLAVRFFKKASHDVHLLEILEPFPGPADDPLLVTEFDPSAQLRIVGKLHLALGSEQQLEAAIKRGDPLIKDVQKSGVLVHVDPKAKKLAAALGLKKK